MLNTYEYEMNLQVLQRYVESYDLMLVITITSFGIALDLWRDDDTIYATDGGSLHENVYDCMAYLGIRGVHAVDPSRPYIP